jgi:general L-amino acid transport system substrate-binding protein
MRAKFLFLFCAIGALSAPTVFAQTRLAEVKARGSLSCAAFPRPGLAREASSGWQGLYPDLCHAIAIAALGPGAHFEFDALELPKDASALGKGDYDVLFLTEPEIAQASLGGKISPGPAVFFETYALMTEENAPAKAPEDLAGAPICFHEADTASQALEERFDKKGFTFIPMPFQEDIELLDAYNARHCRAVVSEATDLAQLRLKKGVNNFESRIMAEPLAVFPVLAATPISDPQWSAAVSWVVHFLQAAERPQTKWLPGGAKALSVDTTALGLDPSWRENVLANVGDYAAIYERSLGDKSPFKLSRGVNGQWKSGGLLAPPVAN